MTAAPTTNVTPVQATTTQIKEVQPQPQPQNTVAPHNPAVDSIRRRIYIGSLHYLLREDDVRQAFGRLGEILKIDMPRDAITGLSKGYCFLEYATEESAVLALATMNGYQLGGRQIKVSLPTQPAQGGVLVGAGGIPLPPAGSATAAPAIINPLLLGATAAANPSVIPTSLPLAAAVASTPAVAAAVALGLPAPVPPPAPSPNTRLYVGSVLYTITEQQVRMIFEAVGKVKNMQMIMNPGTMTHKGYGFVEFEDEATAQRAMSLNGMMVGGRSIQVKPASHKTNAPAVLPTSLAQLPALMGAMANPALATATLPAAVPGLLNVPGLVNVPGATGINPQAILGGANPTTAGATTDLSKAILAAQQAATMAALGTTTQGTTSSSVPSTGSAATTPNGVVSPSTVPRTIVVLRHLISAEEFAQEDPAEFEEEVRAECDKYGVLNRVHFNVSSSEVRIALVYASAESAEKAVTVLNGKKFGPNTIEAYLANDVNA